MEIEPQSYEDLVEGVNCTAQSITDFPEDLFTQEQRQNGAVVLHVILDLYLFYALAIVCDEYFVPAVERIAEEFKMPSDIAGATVMGIANSSPELFTNIVGTFVTKGDLGLGTIVGASVFNVLFVGAAIGLFTSRETPVAWWSMTRDSFFYLLAVASIAHTLTDNTVRLHDAIILLVLYALYIVVIYFNKPLKQRVKRIVQFRRYQRSYNIQKLMLNIIIPHVNIVQNRTTAKAISAPSVSTCTLYREDFYDNGDKIPGLEKEEENMKLCERPSSEATRAMWADFIIGWPIRSVLKCTIPDCKSERWYKFYFVTFILCMAWNTMLCYLVAWMTTIIGYTIGIPDTLMGLTIIAAGTSVPQVVSSVIIARKGLGTMAMNNALGSNIFNILICCGLPWVIRIAIDNEHINVQSNSLIFSTLMLILATLALYIMLACNRFTFDRRIGAILFATYLVFIVIGSLFEMNIFLDINLPACPIYFT